MISFADRITSSSGTANKEIVVGKSEQVVLDKMDAYPEELEYIKKKDMKTATLLITLLFYVNLITAQEKFKTIALSKANEMAAAWNKRDVNQFIDFLTPEQKSNYELAKIGWKRIMDRDTRNITDVKLENFIMINAQQQAVFSLKFGDAKSFIFGLSSNEGQNWVFTQILPEKTNFMTVKEFMMPTLDNSLAAWVDPNFGKRICYNKGEPIKPFEFIDINGNTLSSEQLKGKIIVMNFWSTSCAPCILEMPKLNQLVEKMKGKEIVFIAPAFTTSKEHLLNSFLPEHPFSYQIVTVDEGDYSVPIIPTHVIIGRDQKVVEKLTGSKLENLNRIEALLDEL